MPVVRSITRLGCITTRQLAAFGRFCEFSAQTCTALRHRLHGQGWMRLLKPQLYAVGTKSVPAVMLVGFFVGAVLAVEMHPQLAVIGQETKLGGIIDLSVIKQIGPVFAAVMIAGRVGGAVSAEIGTMRVTEQVDALRVMGVDPLAYLVVPRVAACVIMVPLVTLFGDALGILGGWMVAVRGFGTDGGIYWMESAHMVHGFDLFVGISKGLVFGLLIGLIGCWKGFTCERGAAGVGRAATDSFVTSFIAIMVANYFLAQFLNTVWEMLGGTLAAV